MRIARLPLIAAVLATALPLSLHAQYIWTGQGTGWQGQVTPTNSVSSTLTFGNSIYPFITLTSLLDDVGSISIVGGNDITFKSASPLTLTINSALGINGDTGMGDLDFSSNINIAIVGATTFDAGQNSVYVRGQVTGTGPLTLTGSGGGSGTGVFIFNNATGNTYTGNTTIGDGTNFIDVAFWNSSPFGTGTVTFADGGELISHGANTIANNLVIDSVGSNFALVIKSWDAPLTFTGSVTLDANATISPREPTAAQNATNNSGSVPVPGEGPTNPIIFSGSIGQSGGARSLTLTGDGIIMLTGTGNTYSGGTFVGTSGGSAGSLVFASSASFPSAGTVLVYQNGYLGTMDTSVGAFAALVSAGNVNTAASSGTFGIDTLPGQPTATYSDVVSLSAFTSTLVEIGTSTSAIITGTITPQTAGSYRFGGGGGTLYVDTPLVNTGAATVTVSNPGNALPLTVYLQGSNTYIGPTSVSDGFLIFDAPSSIPGITRFTAAGSFSNVGGSYIGYTDLVGYSSTQSSLFLAQFNQANTWGIIGFDSSNILSPVTINGVDLTGFNNGVFIGTATAATLTGTLTPTTVAATGQTANTLRLTAAQGGVLTVDSTIADNGSAVALLLGSPSFPQYSSGTVVLNGANSFSGGTTITTVGVNSANLAQTIEVGNNAAFGTGGVSLTEGGLAGIEASTAGITISNSLTFLDPSPSNSAELFLRGTNSFTLSGAITGDSSSRIVLENTSPLAATISGNNTNFAGTFVAYNGTLSFQNSNSLGSGNLDFEGPATIDLTGVLAPVIESINDGKANGAFGNLVLAPGSVLTIDTSHDASDSSPTFGGVISGVGSSLTVTDSMGTGTVVLLFGNNTYTGGTTVTADGVLAVAANGALGTGTVTVNATPQNGGLALDSGVTLTNPLVLTSGNILGDGTFNPSGAGLAGTVTIGPNVAVAGGLPFGNSNTSVSGTLSFAGNLKLINGGTYFWTLQDNARTDGISSLAVAGNLDLTTLTAGGFTIYPFTFDSGGNAGGFAANFNQYAPASWTIITTGGTILGFNATNFTLSPLEFEGSGTVTGANFFLTVNGADNQLILNFTPVPEPSTWALLGVGLGFVSAAMTRARRRAVSPVRL